jgi:hypothetical protein
MPYTQLFTDPFTGSATARGADFGVWTQHVLAGHPTIFHRNGSGLCVVEGDDTGDGIPAMLVANTGLTNVASTKVIFDLAPWDTSNSNFQYTLAARFYNMSLSGGQPTFLGAILKGSSIFLRGDSSNGQNQDYGPVFAPSDGVAYRVELDIAPNVSDPTATDITLTYWDRADLATSLGTATTTFSDPLLQSPAPAAFGIRSAANWTAAWGMDAVTQNNLANDTTAPTFVSGQSYRSGKVIEITCDDDQSFPLLPASGVTGILCRQRQDSGHAWTAATLSNGRRVGSTSVFRFDTDVYVRKGYQIQVSASGSNITDSAPTPNTLADFAYTDITNNSATVSAPLVTPLQAQLLSTRGGAGVEGPGGIDNANRDGTHEVQAQHRMVLPYGGKSGFHLKFPGFWDGVSTADIQIVSAGMGIEEPGQVRRYVRLKFGGSNNGSVAPYAMLSTDPVAETLLPGTVIYPTYLYRISDTAQYLPTTGWWWGRETVPGTDDSTLAEIGLSGALTDKTQTGGIHRPASNEGLPAAVSNGGSSFDIWTPAGVFGSPHDNYSGTYIAFAGCFDSLGVAKHDEPAEGDDASLAFVRAYGSGFFGRICGELIPWTKWGVGGSSSSSWLTPAGNHSAVVDAIVGTGTAGGGTLPRMVTHLWTEYGINELRQYNSSGGTVTEAQYTTVCKANRTAIGAIAADRSLPLIQTTLTAANSTWQSNWSSTANFATQRGIYNDWVRTFSNVAGCIAALDLAQPIETAVNSNVWLNEGDGIHPSATQHQAIANRYSTDVAPAVALHQNPVDTSNSGARVGDASANQSLGLDRTLSLSLSL